MLFLFKHIANNKKNYINSSGLHTRHMLLNIFKIDDKEKVSIF